MISRSRDMVSTHQNFNGSHDLTTPPSGMVCHPHAMTSLPTKFEASISNHYDDIKKDAKCRKMGGFK